MKQSLLNEYAGLATKCRISLAIGQLMCGAPQMVIKAVKSVLIDPEHNRYIPVGGSQKAREAVVEAFAQMGLKATPEQCMLGNGAKSLFRLALLALTKVRDAVIFFSPGYPPYWRAAELLERKAVAIDLDGSFVPDLEQLESAILVAKAEGRGCVLVLCDPSNPTGVVWGQETLEAISSVIKRYEVMVIADETYGDFVYDGLEFVPFARVHGTDDTTTIRSPSKELGLPGYRGGYAMGHKKVIENMVAIAGELDGCPNVFANVVATLLPKRQSFVWQQLAHLLANREVVLEWLKQHGNEHAPLDGGFFAWVKLPLPKGMGSKQFADILREREVGIIPGEAFVKEGELGLQDDDRGWVRISYAGDGGMLKEGLNIISATLAEIARS